MTHNEIRRARLERLKERFTALNLRSRTLRLNRLTKTGALDLHRLRTLAPDVLQRLTEHLGIDDEGTFDIVPQRSTPKPQQELADDLSSLAASARSDWLETGLQDLAIGWPILEGQLPDGTWLRSPLLLYPVWLHATESGQLTWQLELRGLPELNSSLAQTLKRLAGAALDMPTLLAHDDDRILALDDPTWAGFHNTLTTLGLTLASDPTHLPGLEAFTPRSNTLRDDAQPGILTLHHHLILGRFPPSGSAVVGDYEALLAAPLTDAALACAVDLLSVDEDALPAPPPERERETPTPTAPLEGSRQFLTQPSDSSQDALVRWLDDDPRGIIVQGPPGTGKSQLITHLVTAGIARSMRILVVCEKRAALDVVAERLAHTGLGEPLALVHDTSADRNPVCQAIHESYQRLEREDDTPAPHAHTSTLERARTRLALTQEAFDALTQRHRGRPALAELDERLLRDDGRPLPDLSALATTSEPDARAAIPRLDALAAETEALATPHPLSWRGDWSRDDPQAQRALLEELLALLDDLAHIEGGHLTPREALAQEALWHDARSVLRLFEEGEARARQRFLLFWVWTEGQAITGAWRAVMQRLERARRNLQPVPYELILEDRDTVATWVRELEVLESIASRWYRVLHPRWWSLRKLPFTILDRCPSFYEEARTLTLGKAAPVNVLRLCRDALDWQELVAALPVDNPFLDFGFQGSLAEIEEAIHELQVHHDRIHALHRIHEALRSAGPDYHELPHFDTEREPRDEPLLAAALADAQRAQAMRALTDRGERLRDLLATYGSTLPDHIEALLERAGEGDFEGARRDLNRFRAAWDEVPRAVTIDTMLAQEPGWMRHFLRHWRRHPNAPLTAGEDAMLALERGWRARILDGRSRRALEAPLVDHTLLDALEEDIERCEAAAAEGVLATYRARLRTRMADEEAAKVLRKLSYQARKRRYRMTLRQLIAEFWEGGLADLRPVWLCSPDSVASMFPMEPGFFDLVIFDEASQCPVESAVPVAARAKRLVIAGDDQQMPPTTFFQAARGVDDEADGSALLSSQSVLELAQVAYPRTTLRWHYRSHHEALVAFSNRAFYGGQLITAPRAQRAQNTAVEGLHFTRVEGLWQDQRNAVEAHAVVRHVRLLLGETTPLGGPPSVGVVAFNLNQAELIERTLEHAAIDDEVLRKRLAADRRRPPIEQLFVRNLENVQGDERDVILFSTGYGPSEPGGKVHARFGPLGVIGGEKRLNVAITRARLGVHVVCSMDPDMLDVAHTRRVGPKLLKRYLLYVRAMSQDDTARASALLDQVESLMGGEEALHMHAARQERRLGARVMRQLAEALEERGLAVARDHGIGNARIDIAVGTEPGNWRLGLDGTAFLTEPDPLTRDVYTHAYWKRLGWQIMRVTPGMWREDRAELLESIEAAVKEMG